jgi:hypothetical protein
MNLLGINLTILIILAQLRIVWYVDQNIGQDGHGSKPPIVSEQLLIEYLVPDRTILLLDNRTQEVIKLDASGDIVASRPFVSQFSALGVSGRRNLIIVIGTHDDRSLRLLDASTLQDLESVDLSMWIDFISDRDGTLAIDDTLGLAYVSGSKIVFGESGDTIGSAAFLVTVSLDSRLAVDSRPLSSSEYDSVGSTIYSSSVADDGSLVYLIGRKAEVALRYSTMSPSGREDYAAHVGRIGCVGTLGNLDPIIVVDVGNEVRLMPKMGILRGETPVPGEFRLPTGRTPYSPGKLKSPCKMVTDSLVGTVFILDRDQDALVIIDLVSQAVRTRPLACGATDIVYAHDLRRVAVACSRGSRVRVLDATTLVSGNERGGGASGRPAT